MPYVSLRKDVCLKFTNFTSVKSILTMVKYLFFMLIIYTFLIMFPLESTASPTAAVVSVDTGKEAYKFLSSAATFTPSLIILTALL